MSYKVQRVTEKGGVLSMKCFGSYDNDRVCGLCYESNNAVYQSCRKSTVESEEYCKNKVIMEFIGQHCKHAIEYYAEGEDHVGCALDECKDGYYGNCVPFEYSCPLRKSEV